MPTVILSKNYRPENTPEGTLLPPGTAVDLPADEISRIVDLGIAQNPDDADKAPDELKAIRFLESIGYVIEGRNIKEPRDPKVVNKTDDKTKK
jgi:hypothetical protein